MTADALLFLIPSMNTSTFLTLANDMLGYSPARAADLAELKNQQHLLSCLASFRDKNSLANVKSADDVYDLVYYGCLFASEDEDMSAILEILNGMPFALTSTRIRGIQAAIATGSLRKWKTAIMRGCRADQPKLIRKVYDHLYMQFCAIGLTEAFSIKHKRALPDQTFTLEG